jgi:tRNA threonylcarbamoyladenosine biosynthesis protein TsaE
MRVERTPDGLAIEVESEAETDLLGIALAGVVGPGTVIGLVGPLGAGKTKLVRALASSLGVDPEAVTSPTFVLIHEYEGTLPVFHFDAYRLAGAADFEALGVGDYWDAGGVCLVEWADKVAAAMPRPTWWLTIEPTGPLSRRVNIDAPDLAGLEDVLQQTGRGL